MLEKNCIFQEENSSLFGLLLQIKDFLIQIVINKTKRNPVLCAIACKCLEEIEQFFPGILFADVEKIFICCQCETSPIFQSYSSLLILIISHITQAKFSITDNSIQENSNNTEKQKLCRKSSGNELEVLSAVVFIMDLIPLMTTMTSYHIMKHLVQIVKDTPDLLPITFKTWVPRLMYVSHPALFHLCFYMNKEFGTDLFTCQEEQNLLNQLILCSHHPALTTTHRLLYMDWIEACLDKKVHKSRWNMPSDQLLLFIPNSFDGPDTQEKKLKLLATFTPNNQNYDLLMKALQNLKKYIIVNQSIRGSSSLFRTLFCYFILHNNKMMKDEIQRFILDLVQDYPHFCNCVLDYFQCIRHYYPDSMFVHELMTDLIEVITELPLKTIQKNFESYLLILEKVLLEKSEICKPQIILKFIKKMLENTNVCQSGDWLLGNSILSVCCSFLQYQNINCFYTEFGEILYQMMQFEDVDIKIQAKLYYSALTLLSSQKVQKLFENQNHSLPAKQSLCNLVTGNSAFHLTHPIQHLQNPVLKLERISPAESQLETKIIQDISFEITKDILDKYHKYIYEDFVPVVTIPLTLQFTEWTNTKFEILYCIVFKFFSLPYCDEINDIEVLLAKKNTKSNEVVNLILCPNSPKPLNVKCRAEFTCQDGRSYQNDIPSINVLFEDLFLPLPVPPFLYEKVSENVWRRKLFDTLWTHFDLQSDKGIFSSTCQQSVHKLKVSKSKLNEITNQWKKFYIQSLNSNTKERFDFGILLPKCCHLLMKIELIKDIPILHIMTDNWSIFPLLSSYLQKLESVKG
ncbi:AP-5 complex subunit beta-1-like isoform X1 [Centruroides sculpturatus]|uniref:AP-5 complex subunit beta-1-like isoform X1 n=2 Tax=Centruroides sculpturatus TaxID=218467 RepID=UPI000C6D6C28|nr:AP-5 complex subunit beta-1-like isoform X1 [Centruroides sculpturatus]